MKKKKKPVFMEFSVDLGLKDIKMHKNNKKYRVA